MARHRPRGAQYRAPAGRPPAPHGPGGPLPRHRARELDKKGDEAGCMKAVSDAKEQMDKS